MLWTKEKKHDRRSPRMTTHETNCICPRCHYPLIPVHAVERGKRRVVALTCPEPYCDHMQMVTKKEAKRIDAAEASLRRAAAE